MRRSPFERFLFCVGLVVLAPFLLAAECPVHKLDKNEEVIRTDSEFTILGQGISFIGGEDRTTLECMADPGSSDAYWFGQFRLKMATYNLHAITGLPDPGRDQANFGGIHGLEMDLDGSDPLVFHGLYCQPYNGGTQVFVADSLNGTGNALNFPGGNWMELKIVNDGNSTTFSARPEDETEFQVVDTLMNLQQGNYIPGIGVFNIGDGARALFTGFNLESYTFAPRVGFDYDEPSQDVIRGGIGPLFSTWGRIAQGELPVNEMVSATGLDLETIRNYHNQLRKRLPWDQAGAEPWQQKHHKKASKSLDKHMGKLSKALDKLEAKNPKLDKLEKTVVKLIRDGIKTYYKLQPKVK